MVNCRICIAALNSSHIIISPIATQEVNLMGKLAKKEDKQAKKEKKPEPEPESPEEEVDEDEIDDEELDDEIDYFDGEVSDEDEQLLEKIN